MQKRLSPFSTGVLARDVMWRWSTVNRTFALMELMAHCRGVQKESHE